MYPRIYKRNETDFNHNGYGVLKDLIKCEVIEEDNGMFELEGQYTVSSFLFEHIEEENIIKAWASEELGEQLFRIYRVQKNLDGYITFNAQHITYDLLDNFIESIELVDVTCENAINEIFNHCAYKTSFKGYSDITHKGNIMLQRVNPMEAIRGTRGSICDTFGNGAKVIKDNFDIRVNANRGINNNVLIAYKKNITGFESEIDTSDLVTVIFPYATIQRETGEEGETEEEVIQLSEKYIYSEYHKNYNNLKIMPIDFSGEDVKTVEHLRTKANNYFKNSNCDTPKVNYKVEFIPLSKTVNYTDYKVLETVSMCDKVIVRDYRFDLDVEAQVIKTTHCSLTKKLLSCELGNFKHSMSDVISNINKEQEEIIEKVDKIKVDIDNEMGEIKVTIEDEVEKLESNITLTAKELETKFTDADKGLQSQITQNAESITTKVSNSDFESYIKQTAKEIESKVSNGEIVSSINQSAEAIKINASKIDIQGATTIGNGDNYILISDYDYRAYVNGNLAINVGGYNDGNSFIPSVYMGANGFNSNSSSSNGQYFVMKNYGTYHHLAQRHTDGVWSIISFDSNGDMSFSPKRYVNFKKDVYANAPIHMYGSTLDLRNSSGTIGARLSNTGLVVNQISNMSGGSVNILGNLRSMYSSQTLGTSDGRWSVLYCVSSPNVSSDIRLKENIRYIDNVNKANLEEIEQEVTQLDTYNFVKDDLNIAEYKYLEQDNNTFGFIAQDVVSTKVGSKFIHKDNEGYLSYDSGAYVSVLAGALKEAINKIEKLESEIGILKNNN